MFDLPGVRIFKMRDIRNTTVDPKTDDYRRPEEFVDPLAYAKTFFYQFVRSGYVIFAVSAPDEDRAVSEFKFANPTLADDYDNGLIRIVE